MRGNIIIQSCTTDSQYTTSQYNQFPAVPIQQSQGLTLRLSARVCDFTWVFLEAGQGALELAWRVNEEQWRWNLLHKLFGQTQDGRALVAPLTLMRG